MKYLLIKWTAAGMAIDMADIPKAMALPVLGLFVGLLIAIFFSYRKPREYADKQIEITEEVVVVKTRNIVFTVTSAYWDTYCTDTNAIYDCRCGDRDCNFVYYGST